MNIKAPFTDKQTELLTRHQLNNRFHPYTCISCPETTLIVTRYGLECYKCGYNQKWAIGGVEYE